jgi:hypothetical protein
VRRYGLDEAICKAKRGSLPLPVSLCEAIAEYAYSCTDQPAQKWLDAGMVPPPYAR